MREIPVHCTKKTSNPLIVFSEKKSRITFENSHHNSYLAIQVDGCVFSAADGLKCDKLLESEMYADQYFVELKGGDTMKAVEQLKETIEKLPPRQREAKRMTFAVFSNTCPKNDTNRHQSSKNGIGHNHKHDSVINAYLCRSWRIIRVGDQFGLVKAFPDA